MPYILESSKYLQKAISVFKEDSVQIPTKKAESFVSVWTPISVEKLRNSCKLHPSGRSSEFEKVPAFLCRHGVGRELTPVQTTGQYRPDAEILNKEIAFIQSASIQTLGQHRPDAVLDKAIT
jgi:hypothetical protein